MSRSYEQFYNPDEVEAFELAYQQKKQEELWYELRCRTYREMRKERSKSLIEKRRAKLLNIRQRLTNPLPF